jgi:hypothetical protein
MKHKEQINKIRSELMRIIRRAVEKENGCIGMFYKNKGCRHFISLVSEEYDDSPVVVIRNPHLDTYGGFEAATLFDIYVDTESILMCTVNGESGEDWDEPMERIQTEGLAEIVEWLQKQGLNRVEEEQ